MKVQIWSDFRCPFCYLGKTHLQQAIEKSGIEVEVELMSFELDPNHVANKKISIHEKLAGIRNISVSQAKEMNNYVAQMGKQAGLDYQFDQLIDSNSFLIHQVFQLAKSRGLGNRFADAGFLAYFEKGKDLEDLQILLELGQSVGLDSEEIKKALELQTFAKQVRADEAQARAIGVRGVPHFVINDKLTLSGAQPVETFVSALKHASAQK